MGASALPGAGENLVLYWDRRQYDDLLKAEELRGLAAQKLLRQMKIYAVFFVLVARRFQIE
jgi:hypothetical protein